MKPGYQTTEFWTVILSNAIIAMQSLEGKIDPVWGAVILAGLNATYSICRTLAKR